MNGSDQQAPSQPEGQQASRQQAAEWVRIDHDDAVARELLEADARLAQVYLDSSARLAEEFLAESKATREFADRELVSRV